MNNWFVSKILLTLSCCFFLKININIKYRTYVNSFPEGRLNNAANKVIKLLQDAVKSSWTANICHKIDITSDTHFSSHLIIQSTTGNRADAATALTSSTVSINALDINGNDKCNVCSIRS